MKKILIINTGGTIGMTRTEKGYAPDVEYFRKAMNHMDSLRAPGMPAWDMIDMLPLLDSSNMAVSDWNKIGKLISDNYGAYDGFVILHGTDTMAYTASALAFMLEDLGKPVVLTGSQIPLCEVRSDGRENLITSMLIAASDELCEVCIFFGGELLRGCRSMKFSSDGLTAFVSPNFQPLAEAGISIVFNKALLRERPERPMHFTPLDDIPIGVIKVFPGIQFRLFEAIMTESLKGIVIETFGAGNIPSADGALLHIIDKGYRNGSVMVVCSQCPQGTVLLGTYEASSALKSVGAVSGKDMTTEAAIAKLYYLFSKGYDSAKIKVLMEQDLRGELS